MTFRHLSNFCVLASLAGQTLIWAHSTGAPAGYSGAPNDDTCVACHLGTLNAGTGSLAITFPNSTGWVAGQKYRLRVTLHDFGLRQDPLVAVVVYLVAAAGTALAVLYLWRI